LVNDGWFFLKAVNSSSSPRDQKVISYNYSYRKSTTDYCLLCKSNIIGQKLSASVCLSLSVWMAHIITATRIQTYNPALGSRNVTGTTPGHPEKKFPDIPP